jgi:hypothetical protein
VERNSLYQSVREDFSAVSAGSQGFVGSAPAVHAA